MPAGYSGTPLPKKLGLADGMTVAYLDAPEHLESLLVPPPADLTIRTSARGRLDLAMLFVTSAATLRRRLGSTGRAIYPAGMLWIAWPKRSSGVATDVTEDTVREVALPTGLVDTKVCAIDETWSGLRLQWRTQLRDAGSAAAASAAWAATSADG
ncbi:MAG: DUF3052 domain-containing protein [Actinomycetota bacterium]